MDIPILDNTIDNIFDIGIELAVTGLIVKGIQPACTSEYFQKLADMTDKGINTNVKKDTLWEYQNQPLYEFDKMAVRAMDKFIEDNAHKRYTKKDKHLLLFSMLRVFGLVPKNRTKLGLEKKYQRDKEDFIKQMIRKARK